MQGPLIAIVFIQTWLKKRLIKIGNNKNKLDIY